ncbi:MAG: rubredoxin [Parvibaculaceae bacterium]
MRKFRCLFCSHIYDEAKGDPESGVQPGTRFEDLPDEWGCPDCGASKDDYELIEE